jgi:hypothetical protein
MLYLGGSVRDIYEMICDEKYDNQVYLQAYTYVSL